MSNDVRCTVLVSSCDRYGDLWRPYFALLRRYWPDCPFAIALITEQADPGIPGVRGLRLGTDLDWSTLMLRALDAVETPYVLLTLEDFFLRRPVNTARITRLLNTLEQDGLNTLRLIPRPGPTRRTDHLEYGPIEPGAPYRVSTQAAFWRVSTLRQLLVAGESAWEFEVNASARSASIGGFAGVWRAALPYRHHVIERGKWFPWDAWWFGRLNVGVDMTARPVMSNREAARWLMGKVASPIVVRLPSGTRQALKPLARRLGLLA